MCILATAELGGVVRRLLGVAGRRSRSRQAERPIICLSQQAWRVISAGSATDVHIGSPDVDELSAYRAGHPRQENTRSGHRHPKDTTTLYVLLCRTSFHYQHSLGFLHIYDECHAKKIKAHEDRMTLVFQKDTEVLVLFETKCQQSFSWQEVKFNCIAPLYTRQL